MRNRTITATLAALVLSFVVADTADAQSRRFFKRTRGRVVQTYSPAWQSSPVWSPAPIVAFTEQAPSGVVQTADVKPIPLGEKSHDGTVVKVGVNTLTMTDSVAGKEHSHVVPADAKVTRDGATAKLEDLRKGDIVVVTTKTDPEMTVVKVDARQKR